jgi:hypothetical protein
MTCQSSLFWPPANRMRRWSGDRFERWLADTWGAIAPKPGRAAIPRRSRSTGVLAVSRRLRPIGEHESSCGMGRRYPESLGSQGLRLADQAEASEEEIRS